MGEDREGKVADREWKESKEGGKPHLSALPEIYKLYCSVGQAEAEGGQVGQAPPGAKGRGAKIRLKIDHLLILAFSLML